MLYMIRGRYGERTKAEDTVNELIIKIQNALIEEHGCSSWEEFIDSQEMGDCQSIAHGIAHDFKNVVRVFGEIEVDQPSVYDVNGRLKENYRFTHHWLEIDGQIVDFAKGTLRENIDWPDVYSIEPDEEKWRYHATK